MLKGIKHVLPIGIGYAADLGARNEAPQLAGSNFIGEPDIHHPSNGNALYVFALPDKR